MRHGFTSRHRKRPPEYNAWRAMKQRCTYPAFVQFKDYGGRGIKVCDAWSASFVRFLRDVGPRPGQKYELDRIDNDGNYEPGNVRWATRKEQQRNKSTTRYLTAFGVTKPLVELAEHHGINVETLKTRLRAGLAPEVALTRPLARRTVPRGA
jgi:hypothetical protein